MSLITAEQSFALAAVLMAVVTFGFWSETRSWGQKVGGPLIVIALGMLLSNINLLPHSSDIYDSIANFLVPLAIPLLMFKADIRRVVRDSGPMFLAFVVAAAVTVIGALIGATVIDLGEAGPQIAGTLAASYIGGSLNFVATAKAVGMEDPSLYLSALTVDAVGAVFFLLVLMSLPAIGFVRRAMPSEYMDDRGVSLRSAEADTDQGRADPLSLGRIGLGLAVSAAICAIASALASVFALGSIFIIIVTVLSLLVASFGRGLVQKMQHEFDVGTLFMYVFFVATGAAADIESVVASALPLLAFLIVLVLVHVCLLVTLGRLFRLDLAEVMIASNACILGPAPAAALAASRGWQALVTPGMLVGLFGYAIGTFLGVAITTVLIWLI